MTSVHVNRMLPSGSLVPAPLCDQSLRVLPSCSTGLSAFESLALFHITTINQLMCSGLLEQCW